MVLDEGRFWYGRTRQSRTGGWLTLIKNKIIVRNACDVKHCEQCHAANEESE
jgi:hypothetical protein